LFPLKCFSNSSINIGRNGLYEIGKSDILLLLLLLQTADDDDGIDGELTDGDIEGEFSSFISILSTVNDVIDDDDGERWFDAVLVDVDDVDVGVKIEDDDRDDDELIVLSNLYKLNNI